MLLPEPCQRLLGWRGGARLETPSGLGHGLDVCVRGERILLLLRGSALGGQVGGQHVPHEPWGKQGLWDGCAVTYKCKTEPWSG